MVLLIAALGGLFLSTLSLRRATGFPRALA